MATHQTAISERNQMSCVHTCCSPRTLSLRSLNSLLYVNPPDCPHTLHPQFIHLSGITWDRQLKSSLLTHFKNEER
jgi:hypothetical protein